MKRRFNNKRNNFYNKEIKPMSTTPDLNIPKATPSTGMYQSEEVNGHGNARTAFQKMRSYDIQVNKVDIAVAGAANIYGNLNDKKAWAWHSDEVGIYTSDLNEKYANDAFALLSTINRDANINYWGIDFSDPNIDKDHSKNWKAVQCWIKNCTTLVQQIEASQTNELAINTLSYQPGKTLTKWAEIFTPLQYYLLAYQTEVYTYLYFCQAFSALVSMLPKLQELYYAHADAFLYIQNELSRSRVRAPIKSLLTWLKRRYIDKVFYQTILAPATVVSKKTDGLNSPIIYLTPTFSIPLEPIACKASAYNQTALSAAEFDMPAYYATGEVQRDADKWITGMKDAAGNDINVNSFQRAMNVWSINTILDLVLQDGTTAELRARIDNWVKEALNQIQKVTAASIDFARSQACISLESALSKLTTAPGVTSLNWQQNVEVAPLAPVVKFTDWEMVNELALFTITKPVMTKNGYNLNIPMFRMFGIPKQMQLEYFQTYYLASDETYISYINIHNTIRMRFRDNHKLLLLMERTEQDVKYKVVDDKGQLRKLNVGEELYVSTAFQDKFTAIEFIPSTDSSGKEVVKWTNPQLMTYVAVQFTSRATEMEIFNTQNFLIPLG